MLVYAFIESVVNHLSYFHIKNSKLVPSLYDDHLQIKILIESLFPFSECKPCSEEELARAFCSSDLGELAFAFPRVRIYTSIHTGLFGNRGIAHRRAVC
jgi:hypothetical protein